MTVATSTSREDGKSRRCAAFDDAGEKRIGGYENL